MVSDIVRELDSNYAIPEGLKGVVQADTSTNFVVVPVNNTELDIQNESDEDEFSEIDEDEISSDIEAPDSIEVIAQEHRTAPDGRQVVDVFIEVSDVEGAIQYDVRVTTE